MPSGSPSSRPREMAATVSSIVDGSTRSTSLITLWPLLSESPDPWKFTAGVAFGRRLEPWIAQLRVESR